jgi:hypothetical protein
VPDDYYLDAKAKFQRVIPAYSDADFTKMGDEIRKNLMKKENDLLIIRRSLKTIVLGDWNSPEKMQRLLDIKNSLLKNQLYAETIDKYYDMNKAGGLSQLQILESCCIMHQLIVFLDGEGPGTITEQNYLSDEYRLHGKVLFFIENGKFDGLKSNPSSYIKSFPTIVPYASTSLLDTVLTFARLRIYRLAGIIYLQSQNGKGLKKSNYEPWKKRLAKRR